MKEFKHKVVARWKKENPEIAESREADLMSELAGALKASAIPIGIGHTIVMRDLRRFNKEHHVEIDAKAFALYQCMKSVTAQYPRDKVEMVIDRMSKPQVVLSKARDYLRSDPDYASVSQEPIMSPLAERGEACSRTILPLQAADLFAWEARKDFELKRGLFEQENPSPDDYGEFMQKVWRNYMAAILRRLRERNLQEIPISIYPMRRSLIELTNAIPPVGLLWLYRDFCRVHEQRRGVWKRTD